MESSATIEKVAPALVRTQAEIGRIETTAENPHFKARYIDLAGLREIVRPILAKNELALVQTFGETNGESVCVITTLLHASGEWLRTSLSLPYGRGSGPQVVGSAITYARRYSLCAILGLAADRDDDGNTAQSSVERKAPPLPVTAKPLKDIPNNSY